MSLEVRCDDQAAGSRSERSGSSWPSVRCLRITGGRRAIEITVQGTVKVYRWANPHVMIALDVQTDDGRVERWDVGGPSTSRMVANSWDSSTLNAGDVITAIGYRFSHGSKIVRLEKIVMANGREMFLYGRQ